MKIKKIFIYLSLVLSSITLLPSTGRAQARLQSTMNRRMVCTSARATEPQLKKLASLLPITGRAQPRLQSTMNRKMVHTRARAVELQLQNLQKLAYFLQNGLKKTHMGKAIPLSREDQDIARAIALSLEEQAQKQNLNQAIPLSREDQEIDFQNLLSETEARRISGKPVRIIGTHNIPNIEGFHVLYTPLDGLCGLRCLGIDPKDALGMIDHVINTRNLSEVERNLISDTKRHVREAVSNNVWLHDTDVRNIANLVLGKRVVFHYHHRGITEQHEFYIPENELIRVHFIEDFHFSKMVER